MPVFDDKMEYAIQPGWFADITDRLRVTMERPDLSETSDTIRAYIDYLEKRLKIGAAPAVVEPSDAPLPAEPQTTICVITFSKDGRAKRTYRHLYPRQHRGGVGIFDLDTNDPDFPIALAIADEGQNILLFTSKARVYRHSTARIAEAPVHDRGDMLFDRSPLDADEYVVAALPVRASGYIAVLTEHGRVRCLRHHLFGEHMRPGTQLFKIEESGPLAAVCWTPGDADLFVATRSGMAIRFSEKLVSPQGDLAIRLGDGDRAVGVTSVTDESGVLLLTASGKGTVRLMSGFAANKSTGGSGKIAMKTDDLVGAAALERADEVFAISKYGKIIRFPGEEVPPSEGVVQGVFCMTLRADEVQTMLVSSPRLERSSLF